MVGLGVGTPGPGVLIGGVTPQTDVTEVNSGNASSLTGDGLTDLVGGVPPQYRRNGRAVFIMGTSTLEAAAKLKDSVGRNLLDFSAANDAEGRPTIRGYAVEEIPDGVLPAIAANAYPIIFGDFSGIVLADRLGMSVEVYQSAGFAQQNRVQVIARRRTGGVLAESYKFAVQKISA